MPDRVHASVISLTSALLLPAVLLTSLSSISGAPARPVRISQRIPFRFEPNVGQTDRRVKFVGHGRGINVFLTAGESVVALKTAALRMRILHANRKARVSGFDPQPGRSSYFRGNNPAEWHAGVPGFAKVRYQRIYSGIDLIYYESRSGEGLEHDFVISPGADPSRIRLGFPGSRARVNAEGNLDLELAGLTHAQFSRPVAYQVIAGTRRSVPSRFVMHGREVGFEVGLYDRRAALVIDPTWAYSKTLGGSVADAANAVASDAAGNAYVTGNSASHDFPGSTSTNRDPGTDAFVVKLDPKGAPVFSVFLGGNRGSFGTGIALDASGSIYVTGFTGANNFPAKNAVQAAYGGGSYDAFVTKLQSDGSGIVYSTYLGGNNWDLGYGIAVDPAGEALVTGRTSSTNFITLNAHQSALAGTTNAFVTKLNASGNGLVYSTFLGGSKNDQGLAIATDSAGSAYVTGFATSTNFPTVNAYQPSLGKTSSGLLAIQDAFVTKLDPAGSTVYSTYLGGFISDEGHGIAVDSAGNAYVTGRSDSTSGYPVAGNPFQAKLAGDSGKLGGGDAFVAKFDPTGKTLDYYTFLGGGGDDQGNAVVVDPQGNAWIAGSADSPNFPTQNAIQQTGGGGIFVSTNSGASWTLRNSGLTTSVVSSLLVDSTNPSILYAPTAKGAFRSTDGGATWTLLHTGSVAYTIVQDPKTPTTLYIGGYGMFKSTDGGVTWNAINNGLANSSGFLPLVGNLAIDLNNPAVLYAGTGTAGIFKTTDGGTTWKAVNTGLPQTAINGVAVEKSNSSTIYAATPKGFYRSADGGASWVLSNTGLPNETIRVLAPDPKQPGVLYLGTESLLGDGGLFKSTNGGQSWTRLLLTQIDTVQAIAVDPNTSALDFGLDSDFSGGLFQSADAGTTWNTIGFAGTAVTGITFVASHPGTIYTTTSGGSDQFVAELDPNGSKLLFSTFLGGTGADQALGLALVPGAATPTFQVAGYAQSTDFPQAMPAPKSPPFIESLRAGFGFIAATANVALIGGAAPTLVITTPPPAPQGTVGVPYTWQVAATGGTLPYNWNALGLPNGLTIRSDGPDKNTATISGTPAIAAVNEIVISVNDANGLQAHTNYLITIVPATTGGLTVSYPPLFFPTVPGFPINLTPTITGANTATFSVASGSSLAPGLALNPATGALNGSFLFPGLWTFGIQAAAGGQLASTQLSFQVQDPMNSQFVNAFSLIDPVSTATGELSDSEIAFDLRGPLPLAFRFFYSSLLGSSGFSGALGNNWMHNFEARLSISGSAALITLMGGKTVRFLQSGGAWTLQKPDQFGYQFVNSGNQYQLLDPTTRLIYTFSSSGALAAIADRNGNTLTITQGPNGPTDVADGLGRTLHLTYTGGKLSTVTDQSGRSITFAYTGSDLTGFTDASGATTTYTYTTSGSQKSLMTAKTRPAKNTPYTQTFNAQGQVVKQTDSVGNPTSLAYDTTNDSTTVTDPRGNKEIDAYQAFSTITKRTDAAGLNTLFAYDSDFRQTSITDPLGNQTSVNYHATTGYPISMTDAQANSTSVVYTAQTQGPFTFYNLTQANHPDGTSTSFSYDSFGNVVRATDRAGKVTTYSYNTRGQTLTITNPAGGVTTITYNNDGTIATVKTPAGEVTTYAYDKAKRISQLAFADNTTRSYTYDALDRTLTATDERGKVNTLSYDANGNLKSTTDPLNQTSTATYDTDDLVSSVKDPLGKTTTYQYDALGSLTSATNAAGEKLSYSYDALNRLISVNDSSGKGPSFTYDADGNLVATADALSNTVTFAVDQLGRATRTTTPLGENYSRTFDNVGRVTSVTNPLSQVTAFIYDSRGFLKGISQPGEVSASFARDDLGLLTGITDPNGNAWARQHDSAGRLVSKTDPLGQTISFNYDARSRLNGAASPLGSVHVTYDAAGNETQHEYGDGTVATFTYDDNNRITGGTGVALAYDAAGRLISSNGLSVTRDAVGRIASITYAPGKTVTYSYSTRGLLAQVSDWAGGSASFSYDGAARLISISRANGVSTQFNYDKDSRVVTINEASNSQAVASIALQRDAVGRVTSATRNLPQAPAPADGVRSLAYDAAHQISGAAYDSLGRITSDNLRKYTWNLASELTAYSGSDGSASFGYDAFGLRTSATTGGSTQKYVLNYALGLPSVATVQSGGADQRYYVYLPGGTLLYAIEADDSHHYYHFDEIGSTVFLSSDAGKVTDSYGATPYGEAMTSTGSTVNPFTWLGQWGVMQEGATGLYYMRFRYYDSASARFLSRDPISQIDPRAINPYQYVAANPVTNVDLLGLKSNLQFLGPYSWAWGGLTNDTGRLVNYVANSLQAIADARAEQISLQFAERAFDWYEMTTQRANGLWNFRSRMFLEPWRDARQSGQLVDFEEWFVGQFSSDLAAEEEAAVQAIEQATGELADAASTIKTLGNGLRTVGTGLAVVGVAIQTGQAVYEDVHNGAGVVLTTTDAVATVAANALVLSVPGAPVVDALSGGSVVSSVHAALVTPNTALVVAVTRTTTKDADNIKRIYTRSPVGRWLWRAGEWLADNVDLGSIARPITHF